MKFILRVHCFLDRLSTLSFILIVTILSYIITTPLVIIFNSYDTSGPNISKLNLFQIVVVASIIAPLLETLVFQSGIYHLIQCIKFLKRNKIAFILFSGLFFGVEHYYSFFYVFYAFIMGLILAYSYDLYKKKQVSPFWVVTAIHCLRNSITTILCIFSNN